MLLLLARLRQRSFAHEGRLHLGDDRQHRDDDEAIWGGRVNRLPRRRERDVVLLARLDERHQLDDVAARAVEREDEHDARPPALDVVEDLRPARRSTPENAEMPRSVWCVIPASCGTDNEAGRKFCYE